jgi:hypothetical protein
MREDPLVSRVRSSNTWNDRAKSRIGDIVSRGRFVQLSREEIADVYQRYFLGTTLGRQTFITSKGPLPHWKRAVSDLFGSRIRKESLEKIELLLFNHYDHGFEIIGRSISPEPLLEVAKEVSRDYNLRLQVQEEGNPFGEP